VVIGLLVQCDVRKAWVCRHVGKHGADEGNKHIVRGVKAGPASSSSEAESPDELEARAARHVHACRSVRPNSNGREQ